MDQYCYHGPVMEQANHMVYYKVPAQVSVISTHAIVAVLRVSKGP